ncbi:MAG TPA: hypothetical protein VF382_08805 [Actinomycetota bacterium]
MRATYEECEGYLAGVAQLMERCGVVFTKPAPDEDLELCENDAGFLSFELIGELPEGDWPGGATVEVREELGPIGDGRYRTSRYEYELIDRARDYRRAFHLHDPEWFEREFLVVVHEHCERPLNHVDCQHYAGAPIEDSYVGVMGLLDAWVAEPADCGSLTCLG